MYVEVTSRQTGKTTRMIDSIVEFLLENPNKTALIVANNNSNRKNIQEKVHLKCGRPCEYRTITSYKMLPPVPNSTLKQFVDEFWLVKSENLVIDKNAYYNSTIDLNINEKGLEIWAYYNQKQALKPNNILKRHKL